MPLPMPTPLPLPWGCAPYPAPTGWLCQPPTDPYRLLVRSMTLSGSQTRADSPCGAAGRSRTLTRCRSASRATANRPMCLETDTSMVGGLSSRQFMSASRASETPMPLSLISISTPPLDSSCIATRTWVSLGEKIVAFSISSASRCATSETATPTTAMPIGMFSAIRLYCSISEIAARATSASATGSDHLRGFSCPASSSRFSELRRMRVTRWSIENRWPRRSGSASSCSRLSIIRASRSISDWERRDRLTNIALKVERSSACSPASRTASACT